MIHDITVSVVMITYNHEAYIQEAALGVLNQKCSYDIEFIIADDNSLDDTEKIIKSLVKSHINGARIKYYKHSSNKGMMKNFVWALNSVKGQYIALCEGDDYWTDPLKLQKQVDFLEKNRDYSICFHKVQVFDQQSQSLQVDDRTRKVAETTTIFDLAKGNYIHTPSVVFRKNFDELPSVFSTLAVGDYPLHMLNAQYGKIKCLNEIMAVYRVHGTGYWSSQTLDRQIKSMLSVHEQILHWFDNDVQKVLKKSILEKKWLLFLKNLEYSSQDEELKKYLLDKIEELQSQDVRTISLINLLKLICVRSVQVIKRSVK